MNKTDQVVRRRKVFYVHGFDPYEPSKYLKRYRQEGAKQSEISGYNLEVYDENCEFPRCDWKIVFKDGPQETNTEYHVLYWHDLVDDVTPTSKLGLLFASCAAVVTAISNGVAGSMFSLDPWKAVVIFAHYFLFLGYLVLLGCAAYLSIELASGVLADIGSDFGVALIGSLIAALASVLILNAIRKRLISSYFLYLCNFQFFQKGRVPEAISDRIAEFSKSIETAMSEQFDEILIVGHSFGANIAAIALAECANNGQDTRISLLTLGSYIPNSVVQPDAWRLRRSIRNLSVNQNVCWVDVSAPNDIFIFSLCDPVAIVGLADDNQINPRVLSAKFGENLSDHQKRVLRFRPFRTHLQYLFAFEASQNYDFFQLTAGSLPLKDLFLRTKNSPRCNAKQCTRNRTITK